MLNKIVTDRANSFRYSVKNPNRENLSKINAPIIARIVKIERIWASLNFPVALKINNDARRRAVPRGGARAGAPGTRSAALTLCATAEDRVQVE